MQFVLILAAVMLLGACSDKAEKADAERQQKFNGMYKAPPPSDRSKDKGF